LSLINEDDDDDDDDDNDDDDDQNILYSAGAPSGRKMKSCRWWYGWTS